jgi:hypothetical protein
MTEESDAAASWRFPIVALFCGCVAAVTAGAVTLLWMLLTGMGHAPRTSPLHLLWYLAMALVAGAAWLFWGAGRDIARAPSAARTIGVRLVGVVAYVLAAACALFVVWAFAVTAFF